MSIGKENRKYDAIKRKQRSYSTEGKTDLKRGRNSGGHIRGIQRGKKGGITRGITGGHIGWRDTSWGN